MADKKTETHAKKEDYGKEVKKAPAKQSLSSPNEDRVLGPDKQVGPQAGGAEKKGKKTIGEIQAEMRSLTIIKYPLITEKAVNMIEAENKLVFIIDGSATKTMVKKAIEDLYKVKVKSVNIMKDMKSRKKAIVTIDKKFKADDIATKLGVI